MIKLLTLIGARPQIIKASALSRAIRTKFADLIEEVIVHTGQHYDENMSGIFFRELDIPEPSYNLQVGSGTHGDQTARMISGVEVILEKEKPDYLIIYGDTNSTLAGAIAASKMHIPIVHIEAGLRSYNKQMPEEVNRILSDHVSTYLFVPTQTGMENLKKEGFRTDSVPPYTADNPGLFLVGDVMYDNSLWFSAVADEQTDILERLNLQSGDYVLTTIHRNANTDDANRLNPICQALLQIASADSVKLVIPLHPRTAKQMKLLLENSVYESIHRNTNIRLIPPASFLEMTRLEKHAKLVITDSGGVQKEAYFHKKPCIILRAETEWVELVQNGAAVLCDADSDRILAAYERFKDGNELSASLIYGEGKAAEGILELLVNN